MDPLCVLGLQVASLLDVGSSLTLAQSLEQLRSFGMLDLRRDGCLPGAETGKVQFTRCRMLVSAYSLSIDALNLPGVNSLDGVPPGAACDEERGMPSTLTGVC